MRRLARKGIDGTPILVGPMLLVASAIGHAGMTVFAVACGVLLGASLVLRALEQREH